MIRIRELKLPAPHGPGELEHKIRKTLRVREEELISYEIRRQSLDARRKPVLFYVYTVDVEVRHEAQVLRRAKSGNISRAEREKAYSCEPTGAEPLGFRPVIVGTGPAGLFCGYELARMGYRPVLLERGEDVDTRMKDVERFWEGGRLMPESNVQFGEGGAGTFSDGKLNTLVRDDSGRNREVLRIFVLHGAPERILYESKPHIGTDILTDVVKNLRNSICRMGGEVRFHSKVTDIRVSGEGTGRHLTGLSVLDTRTGQEEFLTTELAVFAVGHSARDTFAMLDERGIPMEPKAFAVGVRIEHPQRLIDSAQYGRERGEELPAAPYKLTAKTADGRGVYTFCMCPGGYVVNASSEEGRLAVNGMSYSGRDGENANSAVIVTVTPEDCRAFLSGGAEEDTGKELFAGMRFQRRLEEAAYRAGGGRIPVQLFADFCGNRASEGPGSVSPQMKGGFAWANVRELFPSCISEALEYGIREFDRRIPGYASDDAVLSGVESRTSSPVRILREESLMSRVRGVFPCGEGAGYAGGITSAAMDGLKTAQAVSQIYRPFDKRGQA